MNKFEIAQKYISASLITTLFPDPKGEEKKGEYWIKSPIRMDAEVGSFSINLNTGQYNDFADSSEKGKGSLIDLIAESFNISKLEAAEMIIHKSGGVIPDESEKRPDKVKNSDKFPPELPIKDEERAISILKKRLSEDWSIEKWGKFINNWAWRDIDGALLWVIVRHEVINKGGSTGKNDLPYFFSALDHKWHQGFPIKRKRPLYNLNKIKDYLLWCENEDKPIRLLIVEGQKCGDIKVDGFLSFSWSGGTNAVNYSDWSIIAKIKPNTIDIWPDNDDPKKHDGPGEKAASVIHTRLSHMPELENTRINILRINDKPKKWDIADAFDDKLDLEEFINNCDVVQYAETIKPDINYKQIESEGPFKILGYTDKFHWFLPNAAPVPICFARGSISNGAMLELARLSWWFFKFQGKNGFDREPALDWLISESQKKGYYDNDIVRGAGVWRDEDRIIVNEGKQIITHDGKKFQYKDFPSKYIYVLSGKTFGNLSGEISTREEGINLRALFLAQKFTSELEAMCIMGFSLIAPFSSFLKWRPHIWLTGRMGIGKSFLLDDIIKPLVGPIAHTGSGKDTEAGIRRSVKQDGCPVILEEMEPKSQEARKKLDGQLELARNACSDGAGEITIANASGGVDVFKLRQSFLFASIVPHLEGAAVSSRFILCRLDGNINFANKKKETREILSSGVMKDPARFRRRIFRLLPVIEKNIPIIQNIIYDKIGSQRIADNMAPFFAAIYSLYYEGLITDNEKFKTKIENWILSHEENSDSDEEMIVKELLNSTIRLEGGIKSIGELIYSVATNVDDQAASNELGRYGIKYIKKNSELAIQYNHKNIREVLKDSPYVSRYGEVLKRHKFAEPKLRSERIGGINAKAVMLDYKKLAEEYFNDEKDQKTFNDIPVDGVPF